MIEYSTVLRISDGLPLSASTDDNAHSKISDVRQVIKHFIQNLPDLPERVCLLDDHYTLHCVHSPVVSFMAVCEPTFPHLMAFSFLEEVQKEFNMLYTASVVAAVRRPYAFTEFDSFMQKLRQQFNRPITPVILSNRQNLDKLRTALTLQPPASLSVGSIMPPAPPPPHPTPHTAINMSNGSLPSGHSVDAQQHRETVGVLVRLNPLSLFSKFLGYLACVLFALDIYRGILQLGQPHYEDGNMSAHIFGWGFLLEASFIGIQVRVLLRYHRFRKPITMLCVIFVGLIAGLALSSVRESWLTFAYFSVSFLLAHSTVKRTFQRKKANFNV